MNPQTLPSEKSSRDREDQNRDGQRQGTQQRQIISDRQFPLRIDSNRKIAGFLTAVEFYGLGLDYVDNYKKFIEAVTKDDILRAAKKYLSTESYVLVVVGDIEKAALRY